MKRRKLLKLSSIAIAGTGVSIWMQSCKAEIDQINPKSYSPSTLSLDQLDFIKAYSDTLIPSGESYGAIDVRVPEIYDTIKTNLLTKEHKSTFLSSIDQVIKVFNKDKSFSGLSTEDRTKLLLSLHPQLVKKEHALSEFYIKMRSELIDIYLKTEEVSQNLLAFDPVPGNYEPCTDTSITNGKAWAI